MKMEQLHRKSPFSFSEAPVTSWDLEKVPILLFTIVEEGIKPVPSHAKAKISIQKQNSNPSIDRHIPSSDFTP